MACCVISSFITKPQLYFGVWKFLCVALYPLSSPNHNSLNMRLLKRLVALYPLSSPNHNKSPTAIHIVTVALYPLSSPNHNLPFKYSLFLQLRYILFHHQTTTRLMVLFLLHSCVISSFITKPQLTHSYEPNLFVALYPLSSPNHNLPMQLQMLLVLRYILFHHQTTTAVGMLIRLQSCVISSFITKPQLQSMV